MAEIRPTGSTLPPIRFAAPGRNRPALVPRPPIAGRVAELTQLQQELQLAAEGEFRTVFVAGEPGIGKTRLVRELADRLPSEVIVLSARGYPLGSTVAYGLWADAVGPLLETLGPAELGEVCGEFRADLASIVPVAASTGTLRAGDRPRLADGLTRVVDNLSRRATVLLALDDLHLADPSSWETLRRVARRLVGRPILVVGTFRPTELARNEVAAHVLFELEQDGPFLRLELGVLEAAGIGDLAATVIGRTPPPALVRWLTERSEGNPLYARGLLFALLDEGADLDDPVLRRLPEGLVERVRARLGRFSEPLQSVLELVAVAGRPVTVGELEAFTSRPAAELAGQLDELVQARALVEEGASRDLSYAFSHSLVRDAVYSDIGGARRRVLHRLVARALAGANRVAEAAVHFARSAEVGDSEALDALLRAVAEAERREAYREALDLIGELVELLPAGDPRWRGVYDVMAWDADWVIDHRADSHGAVGVRALRAIDAVFASSDEPVGRRGAVKFRLASLLAWGDGDLTDAAHECAAATHLFAAADDRRSELLAAREAAFIAGLSGDFVAMAARGRAVLAAAESEGLRFVAMQSHHVLAYALGFTGRLGEAEAHCARLIELAVDEGKHYRATTGRASLAWLLALQGRVGDAWEMVEEARQLDPQYRDSILQEHATVVRWFGGDMSGALVAAAEAVAWAPARPSRRRAHGMAIAAIAAIEADRPLEAAQFLTRAEEALGERDWTVSLPVTRTARAMQRWHATGAAAALPQLSQATQRLLQMQAHTWALIPAVEGVEAAAEADDGAALSAMHEQLVAIAAGFTGPTAAGLRCWADGRLALQTGDRAAAATAARAAVAAWESTEWRGHHARALHLVGQSASSAAEVISALTTAAGLYAAGGADWRRDKILAHLRGLGSPGRRAADSAGGPGWLSPREREVAGLAASGLSARQIAEKLVLSERTIETHLSRAYRKLGVQSKLELVRRAQELGL